MRASSTPAASARWPPRSPHTLGMAEAQVELLREAAPLHDVGKLAIPDRILLKPGRLSAAEWDLMKTHAALGADLLSGCSSPVLQMAAVIAATHHERFDGKRLPARDRGRGNPARRPRRRGRRRLRRARQRSSLQEGLARRRRDRRDAAGLGNAARSAGPRRLPRDARRGRRRASRARASSKSLAPRQPHSARTGRTGGSDARHTVV